MEQRVLVVCPPIFSRYLKVVTGIPTSYDYNKYLDHVPEYEYIVLLDFSEEATTMTQDPEKLTELDCIIRMTIPIEWSSMKMIGEVANRIAILQGVEENEVLWN